MAWMTDKQYINRVGPQLGWSSAPPGARLSTYQNPEYQKAAGAFAPTVLAAVQNANPQHPTVEPVPVDPVAVVTKLGLV